ncbi:hypothetical protein pb186bvf_012474 [Paramecium bursaria]
MNTFLLQYDQKFSNQEIYNISNNALIDIIAILIDSLIMLIVNNSRSNNWKQFNFMTQIYDIKIEQLFIILIRPNIILELGTKLATDRQRQLLEEQRNNRYQYEEEFDLQKQRQRLLAKLGKQQQVNNNQNFQKPVFNTQGQKNYQQTTQIQKNEEHYKYQFTMRKPDNQQYQQNQEANLIFNQIYNIPIYDNQENQQLNQEQEMKFDFTIKRPQEEQAQQNQQANQIFNQIYQLDIISSIY